MNIIDLKTKMSNLRMEKQSFLNDTYLWVNIAIKAINNLPEDELVFEVPSAKNSDSRKIIRRSDREKIVNRIVKKDIYNSAYVMMISSLEDYFSKIMKLLLMYNKDRINYLANGVNMHSKINAIKSNSYDDKIRKTIDQKVDHLFYASPKKQLEFLDKTLGIPICKESRRKWIEYKARRDVIIHNNGIINDLYISRVNGYGQFFYKSEVIFDKQEFSNIVSDLKAMIGEIDNLIRNKYHVPSNKYAKLLIDSKQI